jgi:hypothetical protein
MAWAGHAELKGRSDIHTEFWWRILKESDYLRANIRWDVVGLFRRAQNKNK